MNALALALLVTLGATEQSYGPYARPERGGNHSIAVARNGALLAWSERDATGYARVHVLLLDASGRAISPLSVLPAVMPNRSAYVPSVGTDGESFLVVWEEVSGQQQTVAMAVDAHGIPTGAPRAIGYDKGFDATAYEPRTVTWAGSDYVIPFTRMQGVRVARDASINGIVNEPRPVPVAIANDGAEMSWSLLAVPTYIGGGFPYGARFGPPRYTLSFSVYHPSGGRGASEQLNFDVPSVPAIIAHGNDFVMTWAAKQTVYYRRMTSERSVVFADVDEQSRPDVACTAERCVIAYATRRGDVHAFAFDPAAPDAREHFTVATSDRVEHEVQVAMLTGNRALITWRSDGNRLAGRVVSFGKPKQRAVR